MPDDDVYRKRLGFWLRAARERSGKNQAGAAEAAGWKATSKSTISDYENGVTMPKLPVLRRLAAYYEVPLEVFTHPEPTPEERLDELAHAASALEREDWEREQERLRGAEAARGDALGTQSA